MICITSLLHLYSNKLSIFLMMNFGIGTYLKGETEQPWHYPISYIIIFYKHNCLEKMVLQQVWYRM